MTEHELRPVVEQARSGDPDAWERLYRYCYPRLLSFARSRVATTEQAEDAVSDSLASAVAGMDGFVWSDVGFDGWMFGILRNLVLGTDGAPAGPAPGTDPSDGSAGRTEAGDIGAAFARLSPSDRELLELRVASELDAASVGAVVGRAPGAVRMAQSRALARLQANVDGG